MTDTPADLRARLEAGDWRALTEPVNWVLLEVALMVDPSWWPPARALCAGRLLESTPGSPPEQMAAWEQRRREARGERGVEATADIDIAWARERCGDDDEFEAHRVALDLLAWNPPGRWDQGTPDRGEAGTRRARD